MKSKLNKEKGFTIIEVLIVLAIAGLILLIIFLAVPALQRNSRNTQRKNDVAALLGGVSNYSNNNNGDLPNGCTNTPPGGTANNNVAILQDTSVTTEIQAQVSVGYYNRGACVSTTPTVTGIVGMHPTACTGTCIPAGTLNTAPEDYVVIRVSAGCNPNGDNSVVAGGGRSYAAAYAIESGNNIYSQVCQES